MIVKKSVCLNLVEPTYIEQKKNLLFASKEKCFYHLTFKTIFKFLKYFCNIDNQKVFKPHFENKDPSKAQALFHRMLENNQK